MSKLTAWLKSDMCWNAMSSLTAKEPSNTNQTFLLEQMMPIIMTHLGGFLSFFEVQTLKAACVVLLRTDRNGLKISMGSSDWGSFSHTWVWVFDAGYYWKLTFQLNICSVSQNWLSCYWGNRLIGLCLMTYNWYGG